MEYVWCLLGHLQDQNRNRLQISACAWAETDYFTVDDTASPGRPAEPSTLDANEPDHLSELHSWFSASSYAMSDCH